MKITPEEVMHVAKLARLEIGPDELEKFTSQLDTILDYMDKLRGVNTDGVQPTYHAMENLVNVLREDKIGETLPVDKALMNAPVRMGNFVKVPRITEEVE